MAITYPLEFPTTIGIADSNLKARSATGLSESPFTLSQQVYSWPGSMWMLDIQMPLMNYEQSREYQAFLSKLYGRFGTFTIVPPCVRQTSESFSFTSKNRVRGTSTGASNVRETGGLVVRSVLNTIVVNGDNQTGNCLDVTGFPPSTTDVLQINTFFQLGTGSSTKLYQVLDNIDSDASGNATLPIFPKLRESPANNEALILENPKGLFRLNVDRTEYPSNNNCLFSISFTAIEVVSG